MVDDQFHVYDTTLRDGAQQEGLNLTVADKLVIARHLDRLGVGFIEGGWPGAIPKDTEFFRRAQTELELGHATLAAFGSTRKAGVKAADDPQVAALRESRAPVVTLVAKSHDRHVELALRTTLDENLAMIADTVKHLTTEGQRVFVDAEHFFDGYRANPAYAIECIRAATEAGASVVALCDTNGGMMPTELGDVVQAVAQATQARLGIHCHDDTGCGVANTLVAVEAGVTHVQGTANGYGERAGNANLFSVVAGPAAQEGQRRSRGRRHPRDGAHRPRDQRGHQRHPRHPPALRRLLRVRAQGGAARLRHPGRPDALPAHRPGAGRQRHADAGLRHGRPGLGRAEGPRARLRPVAAARRSSAGSPTRSRSSRRAVTRSRRPTRASSCCSATSWRASAGGTSPSSPGG